MKRLTTLLAVLLLTIAAQANDHRRDSIMGELRAMPDDSVMLRRAYITAQTYMNEMWALDILDFGAKASARQKHILWELSFLGSKVRWAHRHHDWKAMQRFLDEQREASFRLGNWGNYMSQLAQSALVLNSLGQYERAWHIIEQIKADLNEAGPEVYERNKAYITFPEADYYLKRGDIKKCRDCYVECLAHNEKLSDSQNISLHNGLVTILGQLGEYEAALAHADSVLAIYYTFSVDRRSVPNSRALVVECNLGKAELYMNLGQYDKMRGCILQAEAYSEGIIVSLVAQTWYWWHRYYLCLGEYEQSIRCLERSAEYYRQDHHLERAMQREMDKVEPLWQLGRHGEALELYDAMLHSIDTLHNHLMADQQEYLAQLDKIQDLQERSVRMQYWASRIAGILSVILTLVALGVLCYSLYALRATHANHRVTRQKLQQAAEADRAKEHFLRNITTLINEPLQQVVSDSKQMAQDSNLPSEEQQAVLDGIKAHTTRLMTLVNNVLDLSRLEARMMKYAIEERDLRLLVEERITGFNIQHSDARAELETSVESFPVKIDTGRFGNIFQTIFSAPLDHPDRRPVQLDLTLTIADNGHAAVTVKGSPYADESDMTEAERMANSINAMLMRDFGGTYTLHDNLITLTFPPHQSA